MKLHRHTKFIYEYTDIVSSETCDEIVALLSKANVQKDWMVSKNIVRNNTGINLTKCSNLDPFVEEADNKIHEIFSKCNLHYIQDNIFSRLIIDHLCIESFKTDYIYRYYDETDYYDWHIDYDGSKHNIFSYILYLNDDFCGGNTLFLNDKVKIIPTKGSMLCFPCDFYHIHKSAKIYNGNKKIVWSCFYADKRL